MITQHHKATPVYIVCSPSFPTLPALSIMSPEWIHGVFYTEEEAKEYLKDSLNPFLYIRSNYIYEGTDRNEKDNDSTPDNVTDIASNRTRKTRSKRS